MIPTQLSIFPTESAPASLTPDTDQSALPNDWKWVMLGDVVSLSSEKYQPKGESQYYVGLEHIEKHSGLIAEHAQVEPISTVKNMFRPGEILYGKLRPYLNKVALVNRDGVCSTDILVLRTREIAEPKFIHYFMLRDEFVNNMSANSMGVNLPRVPTKYILACPVPLPPLAEQQRIVARVEELLSEVDAGVTEVETALKRLKTYRQAVLHHFLSNEEWEQVKLGSVVDMMQYGTSDKAEYDETGIPVLRMGNIQDGNLDFDNLKYFSPNYSEIEKYTLEEGDILFNRTNSAELVGKSAVFKTGHPQSIFASYLIRLKVKNDVYSSAFLNYYINSHFGRTFIKSVVSQNVGQANVNGTKLKGFNIPLPDLTTQNRIVQEIEARLSQANALEVTLRTELQRAGRLRQSVLKQAFMGKLIPSSPL